MKLAGETVEDKQTGAPDEFLSKSKWVRFQVYLAGPVMNILLALIVTAGVLSGGADIAIHQNSPVVVEVLSPGSPAETAGLRVGDRIVSVDGQPVATWDELDVAVLPKAGRELTIEAIRNGERVHVRVTPNAVGRYDMGDIGVQPLMRPQFNEVRPGSPAERAGLQPGDVIVAVNGEPAFLDGKLIERIHNSPNVPLELTVERKGSRLNVTVVPEGPPGAALIGVARITPYEVHRIDPTFTQAIALSAKKNWEDTLLIGRTLRGLVTRDTPVRQLMGPVGIAQLSGSAAELGWVALFNLMAMISLNLGLLNLMPVPVLDGGHIAILAVEGIARRDLSPRVKERILMTGAALMILLMVTVIYNDIARLLR